jgi:hypothetical protein
MGHAGRVGLGTGLVGGLGPYQIVPPGSEKFVSSPADAGPAMPSTCSRVHWTSRGSARRGGRCANPSRAVEQFEAPAGFFLQGLDRRIAGRVGLHGRFI